MNVLFEKVFRNLLTELRNIAGGTPNVDVYYAMQYANGYVGYYSLQNTKNGLLELVPLDPNDPNRFLRQIDGRYVQEVEKNPEVKAAADELVKLGFMKVINKKEMYKDITSKYHKDLFPTPEDVPDVTQTYGQTYDFRRENTLKVDHTNKLIDLDANYKQEHSRRGDPTKSRNQGAAYVIPSGQVAFDNNELGLQKMLKHLMGSDSRITPDYRIVGDEKYRSMNVGQLVKKPGEVETALTGRGKLVMFHGTSKARWNIIEQKGLRPSSGGDVYVDLVEGWSENNVYLTFSHANAENYATRQAIKDGSEAAVLRVEVPDVSKLVADEDAFGMFRPDRNYSVKVKYRGEDRFYDYEFVKGDDPYKSENELHNIRLLLMVISQGRLVMDEDGKALYKDVMNYLQTTAAKGSLKGGTVAYRGIIPPKFIQLDMVYKRQKFKTPERKGGPSDEEYEEIRTGVQKTARRYDESFRRFIASVISEMRQSH